MNKSELTKFIQARVDLKSAKEIGGFAGTFELGDKLLVAATDGVGTKLNIAEWTQNYHTIGYDLVAMSVNDIVCHGAKPLFFLDYFSCSRFFPVVFEEILSGINRGCNNSDCVLIGGEVAELAFTYSPGGCDLAGFAVGIVDKDKYLPKKDAIIPGDVILGLSSSGVHSNGFTKILERTNKQIDLNKLMTPTRIYARSCLSVLAQTDQIKALAHITGGGLLENIPRVLQPGLGCRFREWAVPDIFLEIKEKGKFTQTEMFETFNCGIGMAVIVDKRQVEYITGLFLNEGEKVQIVGDITGFYRVS
jgi:phosphoribosylformylglycinamidine cyclo-ligase